jgi:hypothetical protein
MATLLALKMRAFLREIRAGDLTGSDRMSHRWEFSENKTRKRSENSSEGMARSGQRRGFSRR